MKTIQQIKGKKAEVIALNYLKKAGLKIIQKNFLCKFGEIDLIMKDHQTIVFIEVRYRQSTHFGTGAETVRKQKQNRIIHAANIFVKTKKWTQNKSYRFDIVELSGELNNPHIRWIKSAFMPHEIN